jgi:imidazolonepropionase-like amidohydrolase
VLVLVAVAVLAACGGGAGPRGDLLLTADRLFDGRRFHEPGAVLVEADRIVAVGGELDADAERTIELGDATIFPGFVDLHVHEQFGKLELGVTTVRDLGAPLDALEPARRHRGLRVLMAGPIVSVDGGYPEVFRGPGIQLDAAGVAGARRAVRLLEGRGAAVIKIALDSNFGQWPMPSVAQVRAIVGEAHRRGLTVTAHAVGPDGVGRALAGGVDELAHAPCGATDAQLRSLVAREVEVVATLHVWRLVRNGCAGVAQRLVDLGAELLYGTDAGNEGIPPGIDAGELRLLREAGLTPDEVLAAATSEAGEQLGLAPLGTLVEGAPADVIAVRGDAGKLSDSFESPLVVVAAGRVVAER